jgi:hypothetical protein
MQVGYQRMPSSVFWVPLLAISLYNMWVPVCSGWVLCIGVSIIAAVVGKQTLVLSGTAKKPEVT